MEHQVYRTRIHKFSSKPPSHDAARQRENQRRHRARVKGRIADLEATLSTTQTRLDEALAQIEILTAEVKRLRTLQPAGVAPKKSPTQTTPPAHRPVPESATCTHRGTANEAGDDQLEGFQQDSPKCGSCSPTDDPGLPTPSSTAQIQSMVATPRPIMIDSASTQTRPEAEVGIEAAGRFEDSDPNSDCPLLPPPGASESTIACRDAYLIIKERSSPDFDFDAANEWLKPGFRRAIVPGAGCRVQTHILFAFVDRMTPI